MISITAEASRYNKKILSSLTNKKPIHIYYGGSASGKSYGVAQYYLEAILDLNRNVLALRKVGATVKNSIFALFCSLISKHNLNQLYKINKSDFTITSITGYKIICSGLDDPEKIKSITTEKDILTDIWLEEATEFTEEDLNQLQLRLRGKSKKVKRIRMTFNPISNLHWIKRRFFDSLNDDVYIEKFLYSDNDFLEDADKKNIENLKNVDKVYYDVYALGNWGVLGNLVFNNWIVEDLEEISEKFNVYHYGLDFGYSNDPSALIKIAYRNGTLYILDEHYEKGLHNADIAKIIKEKVHSGYIYCDSAEPKSIAELRMYQINALPVQKGKDSVKHGIQWIKQQKIKIDKRCRNFINEIQAYKYREDKDGNVLNEPADINNHLMDAMRYAVEHLMKQYQKSGLSMAKLGI